MNLNDLSGQRIGQYQLERFLGAGGMGAVYQAYQPRLKRVVALKLLPEVLSRQAGYLERFDREAQTIAALEHPHIVPIYDYGAEEGISYIVMRYLGGGSLEERLSERGALPLKEATQILRQIASALDYAHRHGVIHRDIKPSNVMFDDHGNAFLVDFGIAKLLEATQVLTQTTATMGTPIFMSPEQWKAEVYPASDQYALGVLAFYLVTGKPPFEATTPHAMMYKHVNEPPPPVHEVLDDPAYVGLSEVILKAMAKDPHARYPTVMAFAEAFEAAAHLGDPLATAKIALPTVAVPTKSSRVAWGVALGSTALAMALLAGLLFTAFADDGGGGDAEALNTANALITQQAGVVNGFEATLRVRDALATESLIDANTTRVAILQEGTRLAEDYEATLAHWQTLAASGEDADALSTLQAVNVELAAQNTQAANDRLALANVATEQALQIGTLSVIATMSAEESAAVMGTVRTPTRVYRRSTTTSEVIDSLTQGMTFTVNAISSDNLWYAITYEDERLGMVEGYVESQSVVFTRGNPSRLPTFLRTPEAAVTSVVVSASAIEETAIYEQPNITGQTLGLLSVGDELMVEAVSADSSWYRVQFQTTRGIQTGYVQAVAILLLGNSAELPTFEP